ncbi:MAG: M48 family metalloprotease [Planctomycetes bacterium]|nr:M48 family metalloprotease [Planctomycetota bacterium]
MVLPFTLFAGLLVAFANRELLPAIPGSGSLDRVVPAALLLMLPSLLAAWSLRSARRQLATGRRAAVPARAILLLSAWATPICVEVLFAVGGFGDCIDRLAWDSHLGRIVLTALPAFVAELPRMFWGTAAQTYVEILAGIAPGRAVPYHDLPSWRELAPSVRLRFGWPLLMLMPLLLLGVLLDLLQLHRPSYVFAFATAPGLGIGAFAFLVLAVMLLPFWFRIAFAVDTRLPEPVGTLLRAKAAELGFRPDRVLHLPTGNRSLNAMMVGPLPVGRCLCITDGLLRTLPAEALTGVLAHEIGHARMGHPALLMSLAIGLPLAAMVPLRLLAFEEQDVLVHLVATLGFFALLWCCIRILAHRFEHEADAASVRALGAGPCSQALLEVSKLAVPAEPGRLGRLLSLHPDEPSRCRQMRRYEIDPVYRARFDRRGRLLRAAILGVLLAASGVACWSWSLDWPYERVLWRFYSGDVQGAHAAAQQVDAAQLPPHWQRVWRSFDEELQAATALAPAATDFASARAGFVGGWRRGERVLIEQGPAAARPWFALALEGEPQPDDLQRGLHAYCAAAAAEDPERMEAVRRELVRIGVPASLRAVFAEPGPQ